MQLRNKITFAVVVVLLAIAALVAKQQQEQNVSTEPETSTEKIKVGILAPYSGVFATAGEEIMRGVEDATHPNIEIVYVDSECEPAPAVSAYKKATEVDGIQYFIGPVCGSPQESVAPLLLDSEVLSFIPAAATKELFEKSNGKMYQTQYSLEQDAEFVARSMHEQGFEHVAIITYQNAFSKVQFETFKQTFPGTIAHEVVISDTEAPLDLTELTKIKQSNAQAIYNTDGSFFFANGITKLRGLGIEVPIYSNYVTEFPAIREIVEGVYYSFPGDIVPNEGAGYGLARDAAEYVFPLISDCNGDFNCVKQALNYSKDFDDQGIQVRPLVLKQIVNGEPVVVN